MGNVTNRTPNQNSVRVEDFDFICLVGKGAFGKVWKVRKKDVGQIYAMKILKKAQVLEQNLVEHTVLEKEIMGSFGAHPFIVNLFYSFQTDDKLYFVLDYLSGGSLFHHLSTRDDPFPENVSAFYSAEVILGLETLHHHNIVYRDLKLENILLDSEGHIKLTDFGLSAKLEKDRLIHSFSGTALYLAPEILTDSGQGHGKSVDFWSLGVLIHVMLTQEPPFWSENNRALFNLIVRQEIELDSKGLSKEATSLLKGLLTRDVSLRLGCGENGFDNLKSHPFFREFNFPLLLQKKIEPPFRPDKNEVVEHVEYEEDSIYAPVKKDPLLAKHENLFKEFSFTSDRAPSANSAPPTPGGGTTTVNNGSGNNPVRPRPLSPLGQREVPPTIDKRKEQWVPDKNVSACAQCQTLFTTLRRKHHCRLCGHIFCDKCSSRKIRLVEQGYALPVRVCDGCYATRAFPGLRSSSLSPSPPKERSGLGFGFEGENSMRKSSITPPPREKGNPPPPPPRSVQDNSVGVDA